MNSFTDSQLTRMAEIIDSFCINEKSFSKYDIFCELRNEDNSLHRYSSYDSSEISNVISSVLEDYPDYIKTYEKDPETNRVYALYCHDITLNKVDNDNFDFDNDSDDNTDEYSYTLDTDHLNIDNRGRIYLSRKHLEEIGIYADEYVSVYADKNNNIIISCDVDNSNNRVVKVSSRGDLMLSLGKNNSVCSNVSLNYNDDRTEIILTLNY